MRHKVCNHILFWVERNLETGRKINDMVIAIGYSRRTIEKWFYSQYGLLPGEYLFRRRMSRVSVILRFTLLSITEIATLFHYSSTQNFTRAYHKYSGKTPTAYRRSEMWDCSTLQHSFIYDEYISADVKECILPEQYLLGDILRAQDVFFYNDNRSIVITIKDIVSSYFHKHKNELHIAAQTIVNKSLNLNRKGVIDVLITSGKLSETNDGTAILLRGGKYLNYHFNGTWEDYYIFTRIFYIKLLSEGKYKLFDSPTYILFYFVETHGHELKNIECDIYIPISD
ncbi:helix-turn-helix transcriptional regulator [Escherichia coli]